MNSFTILEIVEQVNNSEMASVKNVVTGIVRLLSDPNSSLKDVKEIIVVDPPLLAKILKLANSAYFAPTKPIDDIHQALIMIGFDSALELALNQKTCAIFDNIEEIGGYSASKLWENNVAVALFGKYMFRKKFAEKGDSAYIAGMFHNIGIVALHQFLNNEFIEIIKEAENLQQDLFEVEKNRLGFTHAQLGSAIIADWNLPESLSLAIEWHHVPQNHKNIKDKLVNMLYIADYFCAHRKIGYSDVFNKEQNTFIKATQQVNISPESFKLIGKDVEEEINRMKESGLL